MKKPYKRSRSKDACRQGNVPETIGRNALTLHQRLKINLNRLHPFSEFIFGGQMKYILCDWWRNDGLELVP